jgi:hypothetical protein
VSVFLKTSLLMAEKKRVALNSLKGGIKAISIVSRPCCKRIKIVSPLPFEKWGC